MLDASLLSGPVPIVVALLAVPAGLWLLWSRRRGYLIKVVPACVVLAAAATVLIVHLARRVWLLFPDQPEPAVFWWVGTGILAITLTVPRILAAATIPRAAISVTAALLVVAACANQVNMSFAAYPRLRDALGIDRGNEIPFDQIPAPLHRLLTPRPLDAYWTPPPGMPPRGRVTSTAIPATTSGFSARKAEIYLPPAYFTDPRPALPVLVLIPGEPGSPDDWLTGGKLTQTMDDFAAAHRGLAPVVVVPDGTGSQFGNPLCMNSRRGNAATYLAVDVPTWITTHLTVDPDPRGWAIGGLSYGGTCALQLATNYPTVYPTFLDMSGQAEPSLGDRRRTIEETFGGDTAAFTRINPLDLLKTRRYPGSAGAIVIGADDHDAKPDAQTVYRAATTAGIDARYTEMPGGHNWKVWAAGLAHELPWLATRMRLTP